MTRLNDFIQQDITRMQDIDDILTFDSETADVYRVEAPEGAGFDVEVTDEQLHKRILIKIARLRGATVGQNRVKYIGLCVDDDIQLDDMLKIKGEWYQVTRIDRTDIRTELELTKKL
jgi:hypothetical protein